MVFVRSVLNTSDSQSSLNGSIRGGWEKTVVAPLLCQWSDKWRSQMWCLSAKSSQTPPPLATCGRNKYDFMPDPEQPRALWLTLHQNAFTINTRHQDHHYCTHTNVSGRNHFVCLACYLYMFCAAPRKASDHRCTCTLTSATEPLSFSSVTHFCFGLADQDFMQRDADPVPLQKNYRHRMPVWSLSESFMCTFYLYGQSCFHHLGLNLSRTAHKFSLHS